MALNLPPDPYLALGVSKEAKLPEIRSAHRKLVLKCHPDKVQDAALKAQKQDEFQKVQQAYELLSDETRRLQYDEQVKLFELRKEMGRGVATPRSNPFEFQVRSEEPRANAYATRSRGPHPPKIFTTQSPPKTYDIPKYEDVYDKLPRSAKKSSSYESSERKREEERLRDIRKREEEDKERQKLEKEKRRVQHGDRKKTRDKEKRRETEEKRSRAYRPYLEEDSDDEPTTTREKLSTRDRRRSDEEPHLRNDAPRASASPRVGTVPLAAKWDGYQDSALEYIQTARSKAPDDGLRPQLRRGPTFAGPDTTSSYKVWYATAKPSLSLSDDEAPRRSSFRRRASETLPTRSPRETTRKEKESSKRSSSTRKANPEIVEPPSPPPMPKIPKFKPHTSAPPLSPEFGRPVRAKTEYPRKEKDPSAPPPLPRASTFHGERERDRDRGREASKLRNNVQYESPASDSEGPTYVSPRGSRSPPQPQRGSRSPPQAQRMSSPRRREPLETTRYSINSQGTAVPKTPLTRHRAEMRSLNDDDYVPRDRSVSPRSRKSERAPVSGSSSRQAPQRSQSSMYYPPGEPVVLTARPKVSREHGSGGSRALFGEVPDVKFSPAYREEDVRYSPHVGVDPFRRGSEPGHRDAYHSPRSGRSGEVYV